MIPATSCSIRLPASTPARRCTRTTVASRSTRRRPAPAARRRTGVGANVGLHAFYLRGMTGFAPTGGDPVDDEDLYIALQDAGLFSTSNGGAASPIWTHGIGGDVFDVATDGPEVFDLGVRAPGRRPRLHEHDVRRRLEHDAVAAVVGLGGPRQRRSRPLPPRRLRPVQLQRHEHPGRGRARRHERVPPLPLGTAFGGAPWPAGADSPCHVAVGESASGPVPYVLAGRCLVRHAEHPVRHRLGSGRPTLDIPGRRMGPAIPRPGNAGWNRRSGSRLLDDRGRPRRTPSTSMPRSSTTDRRG